MRLGQPAHIGCGRRGCQRPAATPCGEVGGLLMRRQALPRRCGRAGRSVGRWATGFPRIGDGEGGATGVAPSAGQNRFGRRGKRLEEVVLRNGSEREDPRRSGENRPGEVEFEDAGDVDDEFRLPAVLEQGEFQGRRLADEEAAAPPVLVLRDPLAAAVAAEQEKRVGRTACNEILTLAHSTSPSVPSCLGRPPPVHDPDRTQRAEFPDVLAVTRLRVCGLRPTAGAGQRRCATFGWNLCRK